MKIVGRPSGRPFSLVLRFSWCESLRESPLRQAVCSAVQRIEGSRSLVFRDCPHAMAGLSR